MPTEISSQKIKNLIADAENISPYRPNQEVNQFFWSLYQLAKDWDHYLSSEIYQTNLLKKLNKICSDAEAQMEHHRADRILASSDASAELMNFPYRKNYQDLASLEYHLACSQLSNLKKVLFVGSGALPLTAIILAQNRGICSTLVDIDEKAVQSSSLLIQKLGLQEYIKIVHSDFLNFTSDEVYDVIFLASLLFKGTACDQCVLAHLSSCLQFRLAVVRSAKWTRKMLYPKLDVAMIKRYLDLQLILHPQNDIINSILLCKKRK